MCAVLVNKRRPQGLFETEPISLLCDLSVWRYLPLVIGAVLMSSRCTVKIELATQNATQEATHAPSNVPQYPNANRTYYSGARVIGQIATYQTNDSPKEVTQFYKNPTARTGVQR